MSIASYDDLVTQVGSFLNRASITTEVPTFIRLAEAQMNREVKHWKGEKRSEGQIDTRYSTLPADWRSPIRLSVVLAQGPREIEPISQREMLDLRTANNDVVGIPQYYAISAGALELYPTPSETYSVQLIYRADIPALSASNQSNWLLEEAPDAYLYGTLMQTAPWLREDERIAMWGSLYAQAIQSVNSDAEMAKHGGTGLRMKIRSY